MTCKACTAKRRHTAKDWRNHENKGHGFTKEHGWTKPELEPKK